MESLKPTHTSKYQGPGKVLSGIGGWQAGSWIGGLIALPFSIKAVKNLSTALETAERNEARALLKGALPQIGLSALLPLAGAAIGMFMGVKKAQKGENQFYNTQQQLALTEQKAAYLEQALAFEQQKRFSDNVQPRQHHGSHADAVLADKEYTAEEAQAR